MEVVEDLTDYKELEEQLRKEITDEGRFVRIEDRQDSGVLTDQIISSLSHGKYMMNWRGTIVLKDPLSLTINQQLLWELKPQTVIEFGAYKGGSALWTADMLKIFECQSRVISIDIDLSLLDATARSSPHVEFIEGDLFQVEKCLPEEFLKVIMEVDPKVTINYHTLEAEVIAELSTRDRFAPIEERQDTGVLALDVISTISHGKYQTFWRGVSLMKDPLDQTILQQLLWELKPRTVIEFGAYKGGSALWMADLLKLFGCQSRVVSIDIDLSLLDAEARKSSDVEFIQGDSFQVEKVLSSTFLENLHHPWLVMEDAHVNLVGVLEYLDKFIEPGDYICVEDSNPLAPGPGQGLVKKRGYKAYGPSKMNELRKFLTGRSDRYLVDQKYADFFGYNATWNMNGYLKRI